jgi:hypothetical protein
MSYRDINYANRVAFYRMTLVLSYKKKLNKANIFYNSAL